MTSCFSKTDVVVAPGSACAVGSGFQSTGVFRIAPQGSVPAGYVGRGVHVCVRVPACVSVSVCACARVSHAPSRYVPLCVWGKMYIHVCCVWLSVFCFFSFIYKKETGKRGGGERVEQSEVGLEGYTNIHVKCPRQKLSLVPTQKECSVCCPQCSFGPAAQPCGQGHRAGLSRGSPPTVSAFS